MAVMLMVFLTGSTMLSLSLNSARRGVHDSLRTRAMAAAEFGAERALDWLRRKA
jgi:hypothetical protein